MTKNQKIGAGVLCGILLFCAIVTYVVVSKDKNKIAEDTIALFSNESGTQPYTDLDGNEIFLNEYLGKVLVVATWASWSPFSQADLKTMSELSTEFSADEVVFLAINRKETKEQAMRYLSTIEAVTGVVMVLDPTDRFYAAVGGYAMPEVVVYDQLGAVKSHFRGVAPKADIDISIKAALTPVQ